MDDFLKFKHKSFKAEFKRPMDDNDIETAVEEVIDWNCLTVLFLVAVVAHFWTSYPLF